MQKNKTNDSIQASLSIQPATPPRKFYYGWVIVAACTLMIAITYGLMYSYSVFFKPLADYFSWDRATVSLVYSASLVIRGAFRLGVGWLADRYGPVKLSVFCGFMIGLGLVLSSRPIRPLAVLHHLCRHGSHRFKRRFWHWDSHGLPLVYQKPGPGFRHCLHRFRIGHFFHCPRQRAADQRFGLV